MNRITRVKIKNYKSLQDVDVELGALNVLVGKNGSGKSNFLDALSFVSDALGEGLRTAGDKGFWRTALEGDIQFEIDLRVNDVDYCYTLGLSRLGYARNRLTYEKFMIGESIVFERDKDSWLKRPANIPLALQLNSLSLPLLAGEPTLKPVYDFLVDMHIYDISPKILKDSSQWRASPEERLDRYGIKLTYLLNHFLKNHPRSEEFKFTFQQAAPFVDDIVVKQNKEVPEIRFLIGDSELDLMQESDGTLRMLGILLALYQEPWPALIGIEEPEQTIHAGALAVLCDVIKESAMRSQIIITTHSPDMIANFDINDLRIVERTAEGTKIGLLKESQRKAVENELAGLDDLIHIQGELFRQQSE